MLLQPWSSTKSALRRWIAISSLLVLGTSAQATGLATCDSGPKSGWQPPEKLAQQLKEKGYDVRRIKEDGGCYEVYAINGKGETGEFDFHPATFAFVTSKI